MVVNFLIEPLPLCSVQVLQRPYSQEIGQSNREFSIKPFSTREFSITLFSNCEFSLKPFFYS